MIAQVNKLAAELGDPSRFAGADMAKKVLAYAGCDPRVRESGKWKGRAKMSKRGSPALRNALYLMAGVLLSGVPVYGVSRWLEIRRPQTADLPVGRE